MDKLTRFFATEADPGKDTSRMILDPMDCPAPKIAGSEINNQGRLVTLGRTSLSGGEVFVHGETHAKSNRLSEVARFAIEAEDRLVFVDPIEMVVARAQGNYFALVHKSGSYLVRKQWPPLNRN